MRNAIAFTVCAGLTLAGSAAADIASCRDYLSGTWNSAREESQGGVTAMVKQHSVYNPDGTFTTTQSVEMPDKPPYSGSRSGIWDAVKGPQPDTCAITVTPQGAAPLTVTLTIVDDNTLRDPNGREAVREAAAAP